MFKDETILIALFVNDIRRTWSYPVQGYLLPNYQYQVKNVNLEHHIERTGT